MGHVRMAHGRTAVPVIITAVMPGIICPMDSVWPVTEVDIIAPATTPAKASPPDIIPPGGMPTPAPASPNAPVVRIVVGVLKIHVPPQPRPRYIITTVARFCVLPPVPPPRPSVIWTAVLRITGHLNFNITDFTAARGNVIIPRQQRCTTIVKTIGISVNAMRGILSIVLWRWRRDLPIHARRAVPERTPRRWATLAITVRTGHTHMPPAVPRAVPARTRMRRRPRLAKIVPTGTRIIKQTASLK